MSAGASIHVVDGPPGTGQPGKTTFLARQVERAAEKHGSSAIAIASLTRTAAHEIAGRVELPDDAVGTLHAHAYRALDRPDLAETPEGIALWNDMHPALAMRGGGRARLDDTPLDTDEQGTPTEQVHSRVMNHRARLTAPEHWTPEERDHADTWARFKHETGRLDFTDLIERCTESGEPHPSAPRVLLLDEAQDFSRLEMRLALRWAAGTETTVIAGDADQALYQWRGADPDTLNRLTVTGRRGLEQSWRVPRAVHALATTWVRQLAERRRDVPYRPTDEEGSAERLSLSIASPDLVPRLQADLDAGHSVMVLTSCGYMLAPLIHHLRDAGIPFHNPYRATQGAWNPMRAAGRLLAYLRPSEAVWGDAARAWTWDDLRLWTEPLAAKGTLARGAKTLIESMCDRDQFGRTRGDAEVPLEALAGLLDAPRLQHPAIKLDVRWWQDNLLASKAQPMRYPVDVLARSGPDALRETPRLTVGSIHSVKGGESDVVYVAPDLSRTGMWEGWHPGGPGRDQIIRMIYVALTRARRRVVVLDPASGDHVPLDLLGDGHGSGVSAPSAARWAGLEARIAARVGETPKGQEAAA